VIEVQCSLSAGLPGFSLVGLPHKPVLEDRVRSALASMAIALPSKRITVNLSPADLPKTGSHFDLLMALALLAPLEIIPRDAIALGEISLDRTSAPVRGALPAAMAAATSERVLICPTACGAEAAWVDQAQVIPADSLIQIIQYFNGQKPIAPALPGAVTMAEYPEYLRNKKGPKRDKRALEIAFASRHNLLLAARPGAENQCLRKAFPVFCRP
jgi:magnesium chelatase family protein